MQKKKLLTMLLAFSVTCSMAVTPLYALEFFQGEHDHIWGEWSEDIAPTCTAAGRKERTCMVDGCTARDLEEIPATGHDWSDKNGKCSRCETTCTEHVFMFVSTFIYKCTICGFEEEKEPPCIHYFVGGECKYCGAQNPDYAPLPRLLSPSSLEEDEKVAVPDIPVAGKGETVEIKMPKAMTNVPVEYLEFAKENNVSIKLDYDAYAWIISDIKTPKSADLKIDTNASYLVLDTALKALPGDNSNVIDIAHDGALDFKATLKYDVDKKNASKYVNLYYYEPTAKKLELQGSTKIGLDGYIYLPFTHCSTYVLNITATPASSNMFEDLAAGESATVVEETLPATDNAPATTNAPVVTTAATDAAANPETGNSALALLAIPAVIAAAAVVAKKRG